MYQSDLDRLNNIVCVANPMLGLATTGLIDIIKFFQTSPKKSLATEILENRAFTLIHVIKDIPNDNNIYKQELEIRLHEILGILEKIKND